MEEVQQVTPLNRKPYASIFIRFTASLLDTFIIIVILSPLAFLFIDNPGIDSNSIIYKLLGTVGFIYSIVLTKLKAATWGKKFFRIKVQSIDGKEITWMQAFLREVVGKIISSITLYIGFIWAFFDKKKQGWHDKIAGTIVIQDEPLSKGKKVFAYAMTFGLLLSLPFLFWLL